MFGINFPYVQMKSRYYLKFSTNVFMVEFKVSLSSSSINYDILVLGYLLYIKLSQSKKHGKQILYISS